jgi:hypothetical protein
MRRLLAALILVLLAAAPAGSAYPRGYRGRLIIRDLGFFDLPPFVVEDYLSGTIVVGPVDILGPRVKVHGLQQGRFYRVGTDDDGNGSIDTWTYPIFVKRRAVAFVF